MSWIEFEASNLPPMDKPIVTKDGDSFGLGVNYETFNFDSSILNADNVWSALYDAHITHWKFIEESDHQEYVDAKIEPYFKERK